MTEFLALRPKIWTYLRDDNDEYKKAEDSKKCVIKGKFKFKDYKNCLQATQLENEIKRLEKYGVDLDSLRKNHEEFRKK